MTNLTENVEDMLGTEDFPGIDNEALDFNQLEELISGGCDWLESFTEPVRVQVNPADPCFRPWPNANSTADSQFKTDPKHLSNFPSNNQLPDSPPDSGSEPPYSPLENGIIHDTNVPLTILHDDIQQNSPGVPQSAPNDLISKQETILKGIGGKRRKLSPKPGLARMDKHVLVKEEPSGGLDVSTSKAMHQSSNDSFTYGSLGDLTCLTDGSRTIKFSPFQPTEWHLMCDSDLREIPEPFYQIDADKGFNYSLADEAFVCQKKNHFQVTCHVQIAGIPHFVKTPEGLVPIDLFKVHFYGVKAESPSQPIRIEQSQSDRSKRPFHPVLIDAKPNQLSKVTIGRLHFSETTSNNMRKKGKPNPDQRYFNLVIGLHAHSGTNSFPIISQASEKIIVRASNPGQFDNDMELLWQKNNSDAVFHMGKVGINVENPDESLTVHGNIKITGNILQPSDQRVKQTIVELDTKEQLKNVQALRVVRYKYREQLAEHFGITHLEQPSTGILAQEVQEVLPDAVNNTGDLCLPDGEKIPDFLVVNKDRIFLENIGAVKELSKVASNLEHRIVELEKMNKKLSRLKNSDSFKSTSSDSTLGTNRGSVRASNSKSFKSTNGKRKRAEELFCSSRAFRMVIALLVLIMAFCAVAMATIYILEWQKRSQMLNHGRHVDSSSPSSYNPDEGGLPSAIIYPSENLKNEGTFNQISSFTPVKLETPVYESILPAYKSKLLHHPTTKVFTSAHVTSTTSLPPVTMTSPTTQGTPTLPYGLPEACSLDSHHIFHVSNCPIYCCVSPLPSIAALDSQGLAIQFSPIDHLGERHFGTNRIFGPIDSESNILGEARTYKHLEFLHPKDISTTNGRFKNIPRKKPHFNREKREDDVSRLAKVGISIEKSHQALDSYPHFVQDIFLSDWNVSLFQDLNDLGSEAKGHVFEIPLSNKMPLRNLHIVFKLNDVSATVAYCPSKQAVVHDCPQAYSDHPGSLRCLKVSQPDSVKTEYKEFSANAGHWLKSAYSFRVPRFTPGQDVCHLDESKRGIEFQEYQLIFSRIC